MLPHDIMIVKPCFISSFKTKHMLGMNLKLNQYSILLSMFFIRYGSTFIQQLCWVVCVSFCKNKKSLTTCFILLCNSHNCQDLQLWYIRITIWLVIWVHSMWLKVKCT